MNFTDWKQAYFSRMIQWEKSQPEGFDVEFYVNELLGEVGEAANILKKLHREYAGAPGSRSSKTALEEELADCLICVRNLAIKRGFPELLDRRAVVSKKPKTISGYGVLLGRFVGDVCLHAEDSAPMTMVHYLCYLQTVIYQTAGYFGIDLDKAVIEKWNKTSAKNGFEHRMVAR